MPTGSTVVEGPLDGVVVGRCAVDLGRQQVRWPDRVEPLTPLEVAFLRRLLAAEGRVVSQRELLRDVWGYSASVSSRAVILLVSRLRQKVEEDPSNPQVVLTARGTGFMMRVGEPPVLARAEGMAARWELEGDAAAREGLIGLEAELRGITAVGDEQVRVSIVLSTIDRIAGRPVDVPRLWSPPAGTPALRVRVAMEAARALHVGGNGRAAYDNLAPALAQLAWSPEVARLYVEAHVLAADHAGCANDEAPALRHAELAVEGAERLGDRRLLGHALAQLAQRRWHGRDFGYAERCFREAGALLDVAGAERRRAEIAANHGTLLLEMGRLAEAAVALRRAVDALGALHLVREQCQARTNLAGVFVRQGDLDGAVLLLEANLRETPGETDRRARTNTLARLAVIELERRRWDAAATLLEEADYLTRRVALPRLRAFTLAYRGYLALVRGELGEADALLAEAEEAFRLDRLPENLGFVLDWRATARERAGLDAAAIRAEAEARLAEQGLGEGWRTDGRVLSNPHARLSRGV